MSAIGGLVKRGSVYTVATFSQAASALLVLPFVTRAVDEDEFGLITASLVTLQLVGLTISLGLPAAVTRLYFVLSSGHAAAIKVARLAYSISLLGALTLAALGPLWWPVVFGVPYGPAPALALLSSGFSSCVLLAQSLLRASERPMAFVSLGVTSAVGGQLLGLMLLMLVSATADMYMAGVSAGHVLGAIGGWLLYGFPRLRPTGSMRMALRLSIPTLPHIVAIYLLNAGDRVIVQRFEGLADLGRYQIGYLVGSAVILLFGAANNAWAPMIYQADGEQRVELLRTTTVLISRIAGVAAAASAMAAPALIAIVSPSTSGRSELATIAAIVSVAVVGHVWYLANVHPVFVEGRTSVLAYVAPSAAVLTLTVSALATSRLGLVGAAIATVLGYYLLGGMMAGARQRVTVQPWRVPFPLGPSLLAGAAATASIGLALWEGPEGAMLRVVIIVLLSVAAYRIFRSAIRVAPVG